MNKFVIGIMFSFILILSLGFAQYPEGFNLPADIPVDINNTGSLNEDTKNLLSEFGILGNAKVNVFMEGIDREIGLIIENQGVKEISLNALENPNYIINVSSEALTAITTSTEPSKEAINQLKQGNITIQANGFIESIQLFFFNLFLAFQ